MEITKEFIKKRFAEYNQLYFYGKLGKCKFYFFPRKTSMYGFYLTNKDKNGRLYGTIWLNKCVDWTEEMFKEVLIHEMIHMYNRMVDGRLADSFLFNGLFSHGFFFGRQCRRLKREYGIVIKKYGK